MIDERPLEPRVHPELLDDIRPFLKRPIAAQRWRVWKIEIIGELHGRAEQNGSTAEGEYLLAASTAAWIAQCEGCGKEPRHHAAWVTYYRRRIQDHATADLLGPGWREREREARARSSELEQEEPDTIRRLEASSELDAVRDLVTETERRFLELWLDLVVDGWDPKEARREAGSRTGRDLNATRQLIFRIRRNVSRFSAE